MRGTGLAPLSDLFFDGAQVFVAEQGLLGECQGVEALVLGGEGGLVGAVREGLDDGGEAAGGLSGLFEAVGGAGEVVGVGGGLERELVERQRPAHLTRRDESDPLRPATLEVLEETGTVRSELGWPVMATPLSQLVGTQAVLNVVTGKRYELVPDEVVAYAAGHYGAPPGPIDPEAMERIMAAENAERSEAKRSSCIRVRRESGSSLMARWLRIPCGWASGPKPLSHLITAGARLGLMPRRFIPVLNLSS